MSTAIEAVGLGKRYGRRWALQDCTLRVPSGRVVGIVGANGAGKSTLLHLVVGLLRPTAGTVTVFGDPAAASPAQLASASSRRMRPSTRASRSRITSGSAPP